MNKQFLLLSYCLLFATVVVAQGPGNQSLWNRLIYLRDSASSMSPQQKLGELLNYKSDIKNSRYRNDSTQALLLQRIGAAFYKLGNFDSALNYTEQSINLIHAGMAKTLTDKKCLLKDYSNLAIYFDSLNNFKGKEMAIDSSIAIAGNSEIIMEVYLIALTSKVRYLFYAGDYFGCLNYATSGELASSKYDGYNKTEYQTFFLTYIVNAIVDNKDPDRAQAILLSALAINKSAGSKSYLGVIYELLAEVMLKKENWTSALKYFRQALFNERQSGTKLKCAKILNNIGYLYYYGHLKDYERALTEYKQALQAINEIRPADAQTNWETLNCLSNIAGIYVKKGFYDSAMYYFQMAFTEIPGAAEKKLPDGPEDLFFDNTNITYYTDLIIKKGDAFLEFYKINKDLNYLTRAVKEYKLADQLLDKFRPNLHELDSKLLWRKNARSLYEHAIEACYYQHKPGDAFYFFEKGRAVVLSDQLNEQNNLGPEDIFILGQLKKKIAYEENNLPGKNEDSYPKSYNTLLNNKQKLFEAEQQIKKHDPLYYQNFIDTSFITVYDVQQKILKDHNALIEIFNGDSTVYTIVIKEHNIDFEKIDKTDFDSTTKTFTAYISNPQSLEKNFSCFVNTANHLYKLIFEKTDLHEGRIIVSPDGHYFPFEALIINGEGKNVRYFLDKYTVSYTYSARYLLTQFNESSQTNSPDFLGVAPVEYSHNSLIASLPESEDFLKGVQKYFRNADLLLHDKASKNNFMESFSSYKIIQLFTHASANGKAGDPVIYFADSLLYLSELVSDKKNAAALVILSACETATGKDYTGEGVFSFNRAFATLGIPSSVTNLWAVDNVSTIKITNLFYKYLDEGLPLDVALRKAKLQFLRSGSQKTELPYYWSGIILAGKTNPIATKKPVPWMIISITGGIGLLAMSSIILLYKINRKAS